MLLSATGIHVVQLFRKYISEEPYMNLFGDITYLREKGFANEVAELYGELHKQQLVCFIV